MRAAPGALVVEVGDRERVAPALPAVPDREFVDDRLAHRSLPARHEAHAPELVVHAGDVRRLPVEMRAAPAAKELRLRLEHVGRHLAGRGVAIDGLELAVALDASLKEAGERIEAARVDDLAELLAKEVGFHEDELRSVRVPQAATVARENRPAIPTSGLEEAASGEIRPVKDVEAEKTQPPSEAPEHLVGDEAGFGMFHGALAALTRTRFAPARTVK